MGEAALGIALATCAVISAKWALDLGYGQVSQFLHAIGGLVIGPLVLLILYARAAQRQMDNERVG